MNATGNELLIEELRARIQTREALARDSIVSIMDITADRNKLAELTAVSWVFLYVGQMGMDVYGVSPEVTSEPLPYLKLSIDEKGAIFVECLHGTACYTLRLEHEIAITFKVKWTEKGEARENLIHLRAFADLQSATAYHTVMRETGGYIS